MNKILTRARRTSFSSWEKKTFVVPAYSSTMSFLTCDVAAVV